ncbi:hypothetical protein FB451DRAFT_1214349 [Mycena latifolia]|nr:hypothetical protein FB451DRAFT_1214349 [Mycena latifolia]
MVLILVIFQVPGLLNASAGGSLWAVPDDLIMDRIFMRDKVSLWEAMRLYCSSSENRVRDSWMTRRTILTSS